MGNEKSPGLGNEKDAHVKEFYLYQGRDGGQVKQRVFSFADLQRINTLGSGSAVTSAQQRLASPQKSENIRQTAPANNSRKVQAMVLSHLQDERDQLVSQSRGELLSGGPTKIDEFG